MISGRGREKSRMRCRVVFSLQREDRKGREAMGRDLMAIRVRKKYLAKKKQMTDVEEFRRERDDSSEKTSRNDTIPAGERCWRQGAILSMVVRVMHEGI